MVVEPSKRRSDVSVLGTRVVYVTDAEISPCWNTLYGEQAKTLNP